MSSDYQGIINLFHNLSGGEIDDRINSDDIDSFFQTLTDVYVTMLDTGPLSIKADSIQFKNKTTNSFFSAAYKCLSEGVVPETMKLVNDFMLLNASRTKCLSITEFFEMYLLSRIMPELLPESAYIEKYLGILIEFVSGKNQHCHIAKFARFKDIYNLTF